MGVFSGSTPTELVLNTVRPGATVATLLANLDDLFVLAGWARNGAITGGMQYLLTSPQETSYVKPGPLHAKVNVWTDGDEQFIPDGYMPPDGGPLQFSVRIIKLQFIENSGVGAGIETRLGCGDGREYRVWANPCQFFIATPGVFSNVDLPLNSCAGGIPYVLTPPNESAQTYFEQVAEIWWSSDDLNGGGFRRNIDNWTHTPHYSACLNGTITSGAFGGDSAPWLKLLSLQNASWVPPTSGTARPPQSQLASGRPLFLEPYLTWGTEDSLTPVLCSKLWDAVVATKGFGTEATAVNIGEFWGINDRNTPWRGSTWRRFTGPDAGSTYYYGDLWGALYLLVGAPPSLSPSDIVANDAY